VRIALLQPLQKKRGGNEIKFPASLCGTPHMLVSNGLCARGSYFSSKSNDTGVSVGMYIGTHLIIRTSPSKKLKN
jgi:hypothetical protein